MEEVIFGFSFNAEPFLEMEFHHGLHDVDIIGNVDLLASQLGKIFHRL